MDTALLLAGKITGLILIVLMGFTLVKAKLLKTEDSRPLSVIALYVISPSVMINAFQTAATPEVLKGLALSFALAVLFHVLLILLGRLFKRLFGLDALEQAATVYSNSGNLIIPIVMSLFGEEWVIYASGFIVVQTFLVWTHLRMLLSGTNRLSWKTMLSNINILSMFAGMVLFALQIRLPVVITDTLSSVGIMIGPVAMLVAGMLIASLPLRDIIASKRVYLVVLLRLFVMPFIMLLAVKLLGFAHMGGHSDTVVLISFLATVSPAAATVTNMAVVYGGDARKAGAIYGVTTLLCVVTMPLMIALYDWIV